MDLLDELHHEGKTIIISTHDVELAYPWADRAILLADGQIIKEDVPDVAFGNTKLVRMAHLSVPLLLDLSAELKKRGFIIPGRKPRSVLDMIHLIERNMNKPDTVPAPGSITVCNVDQDETGLLAEWVAGHPRHALGAMGTRAKQCAAQENLIVEFTYGVIDKCILRALLGQDSLILTNGGMAGRVMTRVEAYCRESGATIRVLPFTEAEKKMSEHSGRYEEGDHDDESR